MKFPRVCSKCGKEFNLKVSLWKYIREYRLFRPRGSWWFCSEKCHIAFAEEYERVGRGIDYGILQVRKALTEEAIKQFPKGELSE